MSRLGTIVLALTLLVAATPARAADTTLTLNHIGRLLDASDQPVNGVVSMTFSFYSVPANTAGEPPVAPLWSATYSVTVTGGLYSVMLGDISSGQPALPTSVFAGGGTRWLEVSISGVALSPRLAVGVVPQAVFAQSALDSAHIEGQSLSDLDARYARLDATSPQTGGLSLTGDIATSGMLQGNGAGLSNLPAANLTGQVSDANLPDDVARLTASTNDFTGALAASSLISSGDVTAQGKFIGDGSGLTNVPLASITSGSASAGDILSFDGSGWVAAPPPKGVTFPAPSAASITPNELFDSSGTTVTITGAGFLPGATVTFGTAAPIAATVADFTHLSVVSPVTSCSGPLSVTVTNIDGQSSAPLNVGCTYPSCRALHQGDPSAPSGVYEITGGSTTPFTAYCDMAGDGGGWTLVMKLSAGDFCYGSSRWTDSTAYNESDLLDTSSPSGYDAKSQAFFLLADTTALRFVTQSNEVIATFDSAASPRTLMTTSSVGFTPPPYSNWVAAFGQDRSINPTFMRAGAWVPTPGGSQTSLQGCGQVCEFCYQAYDAADNDVNSGVGNNAAGCGAGTSTTCSTGGDWSNNGNRTLIWAR